MSTQNKLFKYKTLRNVAVRLRDDLNNHNFVLLYAYNGTGKTRLSMEFKDISKKRKKNEIRKGKELKVLMLTKQKHLV